MTDAVIKSPWPKLLMIMAGLCALIAIIYGRTATYEFVDYDDINYVVKNTAVNHGFTLLGFKYAFTDTHLANWHPLTFLSHMLDCQVFGIQHPGGHHLVNVLLHVGNTSLVLFVLCLFTGSIWRSAFVAAVFAAHPLHVESVAWVAERKDVLSTFFALLALIAYWRYLQKPSTLRYLLIMFAFALSLLSKAMLVTLPFTMLLLDYWPLHRFGWSPHSKNPPLIHSQQSRQAPQREPSFNLEPPAFPMPRTFNFCLLEKLPLVVMSIVISLVAMITQRTAGAAPSIGDLPVSTRLLSSIVGYATYLYQMVRLADLGVLYPFEDRWSAIEIGASFAVLIVITICVILFARKKPALLVGWCWYLGTLVPVIGFVQIGSQSHADRYTYVPMIGILIALAWLVPSSFSASRPWLHSVILVLALFFIGSASTVAWNQVGYWENSRTLYERALAVTTDNHIIQNNLGLIDQHEGRLADAMLHFQEAVRIKPAYNEAWCNMGINLILQGRTESTQGRAQSAQQDFRQAIEFLQKSIAFDPKFAPAHGSLGDALYQLGEIPGSEREFSSAITLDPDYTPAAINLGLVRMGQNRVQEAVDLFQEGIRKGNDESMTFYNLGIAYMKLADCQHAIPAFEQALARSDRIVDAYIDYAIALAACNRQPEAAQQIAYALSLDPKNPRANMIQQALNQEMNPPKH